MARMIIDNRRYKTVRGSFANCERRRKLENSASNDGTTTSGADVDNGCGNSDGDKRRVPNNKVTRLAKKFNSTASNEKQKEVPLHQQQLICRQQINQQRIDAGDCRVKKTVRLFETDKNRANGDEGTGASTSTTSARFRRRASNWNETTKDEDAAQTGIENCGAAIDDTPTSAPSRLEPSNRRRCCVSLLAKDTRTYASFDVRSLKNRPLSVAAQHFHLESSLNDAAESSQEQLTCTAELAALSLSKNASFLHRSKTSVADGPSYDRNLADTAVADDVYGYSNIDELSRSYSSPTHSVSVSSSSSSSSSSSCYSFPSTTCLPRLSSHSRLRAADGQFTRLNSHTYEDGNVDSNVYDTVLYSELNTVPQSQSPADEDDHYENVEQVVGREGDDDDDECSGCSAEISYEVVSSLSYAAVDSDSSLEKTNSLYETKETTRTSQTVRTRNKCEENDPTNAVANSDQGIDACNLTLAAASAKTTTNSSTSLASDDWLDVNEWESADEIHPARITSTKKRKIRLGKPQKLKRKKFRSYQNQQKISIRVGSASTIYIADENQDDERDRHRDRQRKHKSRAKRLASVVDADADTDADADANGHRDSLALVRTLTNAADSVTVLRSVLYLLPKYEAQEISTLFLDSDQPDDICANGDDLIDSKAYFEKQSTKGGGGGGLDNFSEELCDDFDDTSSDENDGTLRKSHRSSNRATRTRTAEKNFIPSVQSQNIYEFMKKARKTVRKSWSSFNQQMRRSSTNANNVVAGVSSLNKDDVAGATAELRWSESDARPKLASSSGSVRWASFKTKLRPKYSTVSSANSSSIFYLNPEDLRFEMATNKTDDRSNARVDQEKSVIRRRTTCLDLNLSKPRPSSPPPPPPIIGVGKRQCAASENNYCDRSDNLNQNQNQNQNDLIIGSVTYVSPSSPSSSTSDLNLSSCSDLRSRFADEPLYQFYAEFVAQLEPYSNDSDGYEEIGSSTSRPSAMELITPAPNGHGQCRSLWCEVDEVKNSGFLEKLSIGRQKLQEAKFEVITSEASYYKSLSVLDKIFVSDARLGDENLVCKNDWKILFGNVAAVRKCSQALLSDLEKCWQEDIMLSGLSNVILEHASTNFKIFVKYCSNQIYIDRTLKKLREENANFVELISKLEADPICQSLTLHSFLMLPMQRITRMPLLVDAILSKLNPVDDQSDHIAFKITLAKLNKIVKDCNENARKFERYEEMLLVSRQLEFSRKDVKMFSVASSSRWLVRSGPLMYLNPPDAKLTITRKLTKNAIKLYFFLFNDILVIAKKKSENNYAVIDYCLRNVLQINVLEDSSSSLFLPNLYVPHRYLLLLTILENHEGKTMEMVLSCDSDSTRQRWLEASYSRLTSDNPEEKLYEEWDCPQVLAVHGYAANQPDELSLQNGDVVKVLKKTTDGWYHGERIRDGIIGWFPGNYTTEIASQHTRAKNLKLRHRLLTLSADYLQNQQQK